MSEAENMKNVPPTEPVDSDVGKPAVAVVAAPKRHSKSKGSRKSKASRKPQVQKESGSATKIKGRDLVPDFDAPLSGSLSEYVYWVGVTPSCPVEHIDLAGINFPKLNENIIPDPSRAGRTQRIPVIGSLVNLTEDKIRLMRDRLPRSIIRFSDNQEAKGVQEEPGTGQNLGDLHLQPRKGFLIRIPTDEYVKERQAAGRATRHYVRKKGDEPVARYMFAVLCADQNNPARGEYYPEVLENTGLEWPEEME